LKWRIRKTTPPSRKRLGGYRHGTAILLRVDPKQLIDEIVVGKLASYALFEDIERRALDAGISYRRE